MTREYKHQWYITNKSKCLESSKRHKHIDKIIKYTYIRKIKDKECVDCHKKYHHFCMDFDHRNPNEKILSVSRMINKNWGLKRIQQEINKCDLVCANCHRLRTYNKIQTKHRLAKKEN